MNIKTNRDGASTVKLSAWELKVLADAVCVLAALDKHSASTQDLKDVIAKLTAVVEEFTK